MRTEYRKRALVGGTIGAATLLWAGPVGAQDEVTLEGVAESAATTQAFMDNLWLVVVRRRQTDQSYSVFFRSHKCAT